MVEAAKKAAMEYRYLGNSGLKVSVLSFGNWLNSNKEDDYTITRDAMIWKWSDAKSDTLLGANEKVSRTYSSFLCTSNQR